MEKNIAELDRLFNIIDPHHPYSEFFQLQPPSKLLYREGGLMAVYTPRSKLRPFQRNMPNTATQKSSPKATRR